MAETNRFLGEELPKSTKHLAECVGMAVATLSYRRAAKKILAPLGYLSALDSENIAPLNELGLPEALMREVADLMLKEEADVQFIVAGCDFEEGRIFYVDRQGDVTDHSDVGFLSIGSGGIHSSAYLMQLPYTHTLHFVGAMRTTFFAKKRAEAAPGVGSATDLMFITGEGATLVEPVQVAMMEQFYKRHERQVARSLETLNDRIRRDGIKRSQLD